MVAIWSVCFRLYPQSFVLGCITESQCVIQSWMRSVSLPRAPGTSGLIRSALILTWSSETPYLRDNFKDAVLFNELHLRVSFSSRIPLRRDFDQIRAVFATYSVSSTRSHFRRRSCVLRTTRRTALAFLFEPPRITALCWYFYLSTIFFCFGILLYLF